MAYFLAILNQNIYRYLITRMIIYLLIYHIGCKSSLPFEFPTRTMVLFCINYDEVKGLFCEILTLRYIKP